MKSFKKITLPRILILLPVLFLTSCMWGLTAVPEIYLKTSDIKMELNKESFGIEALTVSNDGRYLLIGDNGGGSIMTYKSGKSSIGLWNLTEGKQIMKLQAQDSGMIISAALSPDNKYAVTGGSMLEPGFFQKNVFPPLQIWDIETGNLYKTYERFKGFRGNEFNSISFSRDGRYFLACDWTSIFIFDAKTWKLVKALSPLGYNPPAMLPWGPPYKSFVAAFSPDGNYVLSGGPDAILRLWDFESGAEIKQFLGHEKGSHGGISSIEFSPDGKYAITNAYNDGNVILWNIEKGIEARRFSGFESVLGMYFADKMLSFSPNGKHVLVALAKILNIDTGETVVDLTNIWKGVVIAGRSPSPVQFHPDGQYFFMVPDSAARIYDAKTGDEIAAFVSFADNEWLVITSEGYYNSSEKGAQYLSVKVEDKKYDMNLFYDVFYRPDIVAAKLRGEDIKDLITITMKDAIKSPPPVVEISPIASSPTSSKAKVCYNVKSTGGGIGEVRLFHNGKLIESDGYYKDMAKTISDKTQLLALNSKTIYEDMRSVKIKEKAEISHVTTKTKRDAFNDCKEIDAISGENEISVTAFNKENTVQGYMRTTKFTSTLQPEEPHLYVLSIGIDQYRDSSVNLKYAVKDSKDIKEKILKQAETLYKPENIHYELITDNNATKTNITNKITELSKKIKPNDSFILFVAGHGVLLQNQYYMLTHDFDGAVSENSMINSNEIVEMSKKIKSLSQLFIFDTCHAGGVDYIVSGLYDARMSVLAKKMGLHIYASASSIQEAKDGYEGNGLFTHTLLDGLNNNKDADKNQDKQISLTELGEYSKQTTTDISKKVGHSQTPLIINFGKDNAVYNLK